MIRAKVSTKIKTYPAYEKFKAQMQKVRGSYVSIGLHDDAGKYDDGKGPSVIKVGFCNEFGTENIPSRPFIRSVIYGKEGEINALREKLAKQLVEGTITLEKALGTLGFQIREMIRNQITGRHIQPPNEPATVAAKRREGITPPDEPLYATGLLMRSIEFKVVIAGET